MWIRSLVVVAAVAGCGSRPAPAAGLGKSAPDRAAPIQPVSIGPAAPWIAKLDDPREAERAVTELEQLGDPAAIEPLGRHWTDTGRPVRVLQVMIALARPLTPDEAKNQFVTGYETSGRPASWDRLLPFLRAAIASIDMESPRSVDSATKAAQAVEEARLAPAVAELSELASQPPNKKWLVAQIQAIRALGAIGGPDATRTLLALIGREQPLHPRAASNASREDRRAIEERFALELARTGAAVNALGGPPSAEAAETLMRQLYSTPELFMQIRRALVANGPVVTDLLRTILRGTHVGINALLADRKLDRYCGDAGDRPVAKCQPVSIRDFYAAAILGDLHDPKAVPELLEVLQRPAMPYYYSEDAPGPNTQHHAAFDSLRRLGAEEAAAPVRALWKASKLDVTTRTLAISAYPFLARTAVDVDELGKIAGDNAADDGLRQEAATAFARLATEPKHISLLLGLANRYTKQAAVKRKAATSAKPSKAKADAALAKKEKAWDASKAKLIQVAKDPATTTAQIRTATAATKQLEDAFREAKRRHRDQTAGYRTLDQAAVAYTGFARMFHAHVARIEIAIHCKDDVACFGATLTQSESELVARIKRHVPDVDTWTKEEQHGLFEASVERAMLEIGKRGVAVAELTDALLDATTSEDRLVRQSILLALPHIAKLPCPSCVTKLDAAIKAGEGKPALEARNLETTLVRNYFRWAK